MAVILGIDYGVKRIGIAVSDADERIALAGRTLNASGQLRRDAQAVAAAARDYGAARIIVGLPINMDNTEGPQAAITRAFANHLKRACNIVVELWDERLTSAAADWAMDQMDLTTAKRKARRDIISAQLILQGWLDAKRHKP